MMNATERQLKPGRSIVVSACRHAHLGDTLCISPVPRALSRYGVEVHIDDSPNARAVFANNPFVTGFSKEGAIPLLWRARGKGHVIQQVFQGLELPLEAVPKPEIYLDEPETAWAAEQRKLWPADRPVCVLSTGAITDMANVASVDWTQVLRVLSRYFTVVQAVLSEPAVPGTLIYRNLSIRQYMALISAADVFVGGTSGGSHVAAAFDVPSLIVIWRLMHHDLSFPGSGRDVKASFLYPQHWFISAEDLGHGMFDEPLLESLLNKLLKHGRAGRPTAIGTNPRHACGFAPQPPRVLKAAGRRLIPVPVTYGQPCVAC